MSKLPWGYQPRKSSLGPDWELHPQTHSVRAGLARSGFGETSEALYLNSGFTYTSAEEAFDSFAEETDHYLYSRFHNPTIAMFELHQLQCFLLAMWLLQNFYLNGA